MHLLRPTYIAFIQGRAQSAEELSKIQVGYREGVLGSKALAPGSRKGAPYNLVVTTMLFSLLLGFLCIVLPV